MPRQDMIKTADDGPLTDELAACVEALSLYASDHSDRMPSDIKKMLNNLPSRYQITREYNEIQISLLHDTVGYLWRKVTGTKLPDRQGIADTTDAAELDGCYWLLPGGVMVSGLNHYSAAKDHKGMICSLLDINPFVFEHATQNRDPNVVIGLIVTNGGVRMLVKRSDNKVYMQTSQDSWVWAKDKVKRMWHGKRVVKILDPKARYKGWSSGIPVTIG